MVSKEQPTRSSGTQPKRVGESTVAFWQSLPESVRVAFERTDVHGYLGASSIERLPVERAVTEIVRAFKLLPVRS